MFDEVVSWAAASASSNASAAQELVVIGITDTGSVGDKVKDMLTARNITYITDCSQLKGMTAAQATTKAKLPGGGSVMAIFDCWEENYVPANACSGYGSKSANDITYCCYTDCKTKDLPVKRMTDYIDKVLAAGPPADGKLYTVQALWEETASSVEVGELAFSSLLDDEKRSALNSMLATRIASGAMKSSTLGLLEVNNVCDGGEALRQAMYAAR